MQQLTDFEWIKIASLLKIKIKEYIVYSEQENMQNIKSILESEILQYEEILNKIKL